MKKFGSAVILAGGKSTRMGFDKQLLQLRERSLMEGLINKLRVDFDEIIVVTNKSERYIGLADVITGDVIPDMGPLSGIHAGLLHASSEYSYVVACDMPNINNEYILYMMERITVGNKIACVTKFGDWIEPFNAFYSREMAIPIQDFLNQGGKAVHRLLKSYEVDYVPEESAREFSPDWGMFFNINTREDLGRYIKAGGYIESKE